MWLFCLSVRLSVCPSDISRTLWNFGTKLGGNILWVKSKAEFGDGHPGSKGTGLTGHCSLHAKHMGVRQSTTCNSVDSAISEWNANLFAHIAPHKTPNKYTCLSFEIFNYYKKSLKFWVSVAESVSGRSVWPFWNPGLEFLESHWVWHLLKLF